MIEVKINKLIENSCTVEEAKALVPQIITMRQARLALLKMNLLQTITDAVKSTCSEETKIEWEYATEINREYGPMVELADKIGITSDEVDNIFTLGSSL